MKSGQLEEDLEEFEIFELKKHHSIPKPYKLDFKAGKS
jgi:hypothetical protein